MAYPRRHCTYPWGNAYPSLRIPGLYIIHVNTNQNRLLLPINDFLNVWLVIFSMIVPGLPYVSYCMDCFIFFCFDLVFVMSSVFVCQACRYGHVHHLEQLLFYGADMGVMNASGNTALHICALYKQVRKHKPPIGCQSTVQRGLYSTTYNVLIIPLAYCFGTGP